VSGVTRCHLEAEVVGNNALVDELWQSGVGGKRLRVRVHWVCHNIEKEREPSHCGLLLDHRYVTPRRIEGISISENEYDGVLEEVDAVFLDTNVALDPLVRVIIEL